MSKIKFNFEGEAADLLDLLQYLSSGRSSDSETEPGPESVPVRPPSFVDQAVAEAARVAAAKNAEAVEPHNMDPLSPVVAGEPAAGQPEIYKNFDFDKLPLKAEAWEEWSNLVTAWATNFNSPDEPQADRLKMLTDLGSGRWTIYVIRHIAV